MALGTVLVWISIHSFWVKSLAFGHSSLKCPCPWQLKHITSLMGALVLYFDSCLGLVSLVMLVFSEDWLTEGLVGLVKTGGVTRF